MRRGLRLLVAATVLAGGASSAYAAPAAQAPGSCARASWVVAQVTPASGVDEAYEDQTVRSLVTPTFGGAHVRVRLSNMLGDRPVRVGAATVARGAEGAGTAGAPVPLTFRRARGVVLAPGSTVLSDPVRLDVRAFAPLAVSMYFPESTGPGTGHQPLLDVGQGFQGRTHVADGDRTREQGAAFGAGSEEIRFVSAVEVLAPNDGAVVLLGDSITEGASASTPSSVLLAERVAAAARAGGPRLAVVNAGIAGNSVLEGRPDVPGGPSALTRLDSDVLVHAGVQRVLMMEGITDLIVFRQPPASTEALAKAYVDIARRVQRRGAQLLLSPLTPAGDQLRPSLSSATPDQVRRRHEVNQWVRASRYYDGRFDNETAVLDPLHPNWLALPYDSGDNLHPGSAGHARMADQVALSVFADMRCG